MNMSGENNNTNGNANEENELPDGGAVYSAYLLSADSGGTCILSKKYRGSSEIDPNLFSGFMAAIADYLQGSNIGSAIDQAKSMREVESVRNALRQSEVAEETYDFVIQKALAKLKEEWEKNKPKLSLDGFYVTAYDHSSATRSGWRMVYSPVIKAVGTAADERRLILLTKDVDFDNLRHAARGGMEKIIKSVFSTMSQSGHNSDEGMISNFPEEWLDESGIGVRPEVAAELVEEGVERVSLQKYNAFIRIGENEIEIPVTGKFVPMVKKDDSAPHRLKLDNEHNSVTLGTNWLKMSEIVEDVVGTINSEVMPESEPSPYAGQQIIDLGSISVFHTKLQNSMIYPNPYFKIGRDIKTAYGLKLSGFTAISNFMDEVSPGEFIDMIRPTDEGESGLPYCVQINFEREAGKGLKTEKQHITRYIYVTPDGRGVSLDTLPAGELTLSELDAMDDLGYIDEDTEEWVGMSYDKFLGNDISLVLPKNYKKLDRAGKLAADSAAKELKEQQAYDRKMESIKRCGVGIEQETLIEQLKNIHSRLTGDIKKFDDTWQSIESLESEFDELYSNQLSIARNVAQNGELGLSEQFQQWYGQVGEYAEGEDIQLGSYSDWWYNNTLTAIEDGELAGKLVDVLDKNTLHDVWAMGESRYEQFESHLKNSRVLAGEIQIKVESVQGSRFGALDGFWIREEAT